LEKPAAGVSDQRGGRKVKNRVWSMPGSGD